jgi:hypothetical protein
MTEKKIERSKTPSFKRAQIVEDTTSEDVPHYPLKKML